MIRVFFTGDCDGFDALRTTLTEHDEIDVVGSSDQVAAAAAPLAGGHLDCVVHATRSKAFPADDVAAIREHTRAPDWERSFYATLNGPGCWPISWMSPMPAGGPIQCRIST